MRVPTLERGESEEDLRKIQRFGKWGTGELDAGRLRPAWDAGRDPQERGGSSLVVLLLAERARSECARSTTAVRSDTGAGLEKVKRASLEGPISM